LQASDGDANSLGRGEALDLAGKRREQQAKAENTSRVG